ncbi:MAG: hypothetical protein H6623_06580 [Bdellovibrionaceae bacterium]|nr:hypothetical protein [Pseudobdellovibrionaceae bacterium]
MLKFLSILCLLITSTVQAKVNRPTQYVLLAFDGSKSVPFWKESRAFAAENKIGFTYFASGVYFLADADKNNYVEPKMGVGKSNIGFGGAKADIPVRLEQMQAAMEEGHEVASHANAHFDGSSYTQKMWDSEFSQFTSLMLKAWKNNGAAKKEPDYWKDYFTNHVVGFRAPLLGVGTGLWPALKDNGYLYDTSRVDKISYWPKQINGIWNFPLAGVKIYGTTKNTLSMDYNFYYSQSKGAAGPESKYKEYEDQMYKTYMNYFQSNYYGNRAPVHIGHHFSKWNGGAYWKAMQHFAKSVCSQPEVKCVTYKELMGFMEENKGNIDAYQKGDFEKLIAPKNLEIKLSKKTQDLSEMELNQLRANQLNLHFNTHDGEEE